MAIIRCPECNHEISDKAPVCPACGVPIAGHLTRCPECGKVYFSDSKECPVCHHATGSQAPYGATSVPQATGRPAANAQPQPTAADDLRATTPATDAEQASSSRNNKIIIAVAVVAVLVVCGICYAFYSNAQADKEEQAYEYAMSSKDSEVLQRYLDEYANAPEAHRDSIQAHLDMLKMVDQDWTNALVSGSKSALEQYLAKHPDSPFKMLAQHKIDSIDWSMALAANTVEAMELYIEQHPDGEHIDEANSQMKGINSKTLQPEEKVMVNSVFGGFFNSLNSRDEDALTSTVNPLLTNFLGKANATRNDVVTFMHKIYKSGVASMNWQPANDYSITKKDVGDQEYEYSVNFSALQTVTNDDGSKTEARYKITAKINPGGKISELNMVKILE